MSDETKWRDVIAALHHAGWKHSKEWHAGGRDEDGAPWGEGAIEHTWVRGEERVTVWVDADSENVDSYLSYSEDEGEFPESFVNVHHAVAAQRGPAWLLRAMEHCGIVNGAS